MNICQDCGKGIGPRGKRCKACSAKARWAKPGFKEKCGSLISIALNKPEVRSRRADAISVAMLRPETNARLHQPRSAEACANIRRAQNRPELRAIHSKLKTFLGKKHSEETRRKISLANTGRKASLDTRAKLSLLRCGPNNPFYGRKHSLKSRVARSAKQIGKKMGRDNANWKGGVFTDPYERTFSKFIKSQVRERDEFRCRLCGKPDGERHHHVHHIFYNPLDADIGHLITLCPACHKMVHRKKKIWPPILQAKLAEHSSS